MLKDCKFKIKPKKLLTLPSQRTQLTASHLRIATETPQLPISTSTWNFLESRRESHLNSLFHRRKTILQSITKQNRSIYSKITSQESHYCLHKIIGNPSPDPFHSTIQADNLKKNSIALLKMSKKSCSRVSLQTKIVSDEQKKLLMDKLFEVNNNKDENQNRIKMNGYTQKNSRLSTNQASEFGTHPIESRYIKLEEDESLKDIHNRIKLKGKRITDIFTAF